MKIRYTFHAMQKFEMLKRHHFEVSQEEVEKTLKWPEAILLRKGEDL